MLRYSNSRRRVGLRVMMLAGAAFLASDGFAQSASPAAGGAAAGQTAKPKSTLFQLILSHPDPVFFTIMALSVIGLTLIIQGFIKNRVSVFLPEATINTIRDMIG